MFLFEKNAQWPGALTLGLFICFQSVSSQSGRIAHPLKSESKPPIPCKESKQEPTTPLNIMFNVLVTDQAGKPMRDVTREDFTIFDDEIQQQLSMFEKREGPLNYGLLVDTSGSLRGQFNLVLLAARAMIQTNEPDDEVFVTRFISSDKIEMTLNWTRDQALLMRGLDKLWIEGGQSAIVDAVYESAKHLDEHKSDTRRRSALVVITDGEDQASYYNVSQLQSLLRKLNVQVYVIGLTKDLESRSSRTKAKNFLLGLAQKTGGRAVFVSSKGDVATAVSAIRNELSAQYSIGYQPANQTRDNSTRSLRVEIADKAERGRRLAVARTTYVALCQ